jgi:hypothetical protein
MVSSGGNTNTKVHENKKLMLINQKSFRDCLADDAAKGFDL